MTPDWLVLLIVSSAPFLIALFRVSVVAQFNPGTTSAILSEVNPVTVILSSAIGLVPILFILTGAWLFVSTPDQWWQPIEDRFGIDSDAAHVVVGVVVFGVLILIPWPTLALVGGVLLSALAIHKLRQRYEWFRTRNNPLGFIAGFLVATILYTAISEKPWMPSELITTADETLVAYVLSDDEPWVSLLDRDTRLVRLLRDSEVKERKLCGGDGAPSILRLLSDREDAGSYDKCPEPEDDVKSSNGS